ncbi:uncharacterized protein BX663DRAFT_519856 [Cokeromyces recurvatus]|uniref:uncharacterized protein n=1 Tax=Cokeromyces recurvatus TaxID=90255 RepID=UPI00221F801B|nr:uncharacterized protein BX663DRAFT_519856 [Cokeromyces recurvatus]KAI7899896.1 hypothetical protein BX663DRAFT_519856 [Cokeromyces recurvatus]
MSLLITRNCHYAIIVAIGDGQEFKAEEDKDFCVRSQLNLILPSQLQDLIPPNTRLSTKPTTLHESFRIRTTLVYFVSSQLLKRLKKTQSSIILEFVSISVTSAENQLGTIEFKMEDAKMVRILEENSDIKTIENFVIDKGQWLPVGNEHMKGQIQAGLFIVEMPNNAKVPANNTVGRPIEAPSRSSNNSHYYNNNNNTVLFGKVNDEMGLEICSDTSELFKNDPLEIEEESNISSSELEEDISNNSESEAEETEVIKVGEGMEQYSFIFRLLEAIHLSDITRSFTDIKDAYFQYKIGNQIFKCPVQYNENEWKAMDYKHQLFFVGELSDIKIWLAEEQTTVDIFLVIQYANWKEDFFIGYSNIYLTDQTIGLKQQARIIYDQNQKWHMNSQMQSPKLRLEIGLIEGWEK